MKINNEDPQYSGSGLLPEERTKVWQLQGTEPAIAEQWIHEAALCLAEGKTVAFPTETVYGLGADATSTEAVESIFMAKGRPSDNPLIVHIAHREQLDDLVQPYNELAQRLMERFWPGPLTLVLPARSGAVSPRVTAGLSTVAVRMPDHEVALRLIAASGKPIAAPSANRSGRPSPTRAEHVVTDLAGRIAGVVDGGSTGVGVESTVVELDGDRIHVLRPGGVTLDMLAELGTPVTVDRAVDPTLVGVEVVLNHIHSGKEIIPTESAVAENETVSSIGFEKEIVNINGADIEQLQLPARQLVVEPTKDSQVTVSAAEAVAPRSPGMKYAHYAPQGTMYLVQGDDDTAVSAYIQADLDDAKQRGEKTGVLTFHEHATRYRADVVVELGSLQQLEQAAQLLYDALRRFDEAGATYIAAETCPAEGIGLAVMNRLVKAAGHRLVRVP
ncbi:L-threonylcarbamoyladenylate synthase [Paenibacillus arenosi]|uniref:L-threonylcarbamoyladenylate synthase n=1 Tax=Paenibacillus arenosi TaxID=2774142 RepID=A0ABR9AZ21_9BACL|nr:L-threonylcarbamoyladenylate synthase [Paenibacillus arenosi]MBD8498186.1 threonylcarbamoyl-AMP synthase [Paenibacillus arenosi]